MRIDSQFGLSPYWRRRRSVTFTATEARRIIGLKVKMHQRTPSATFLRVFAAPWRVVVDGVTPIIDGPLTLARLHAKGGHFAAWEQPQLFSEEVRAGFRSLRGSRAGAVLPGGRQLGMRCFMPSRRSCRLAWSGRA